MSRKSSTATTTESTENSIQVLNQGTCLTTSGRSSLTYQVGIDESEGIHLKISGNDGGGFWSAEWVSFTDIQAAIKAWPADQGITSMTFRKIFRGKSANTPGFLIAVLCALEIIEPMGDKKRVHQACDPATFLASVQSMRKGTGSTTSKKPAAKAKVPAKEEAASPSKASSQEKTSAEKVKTPSNAGAKTDKTSGKSPATSRKSK